MIQPLRDGLRDALRALGALLRRLLLRPPQGTEGGRGLRGRMRTAVVIAAPDELFSEAVFILRDDALRGSGIGRGELLEQARAAAAGYTRTALGRRQGPGLRTPAAILLGAAGMILCLWALGML